MPRPGTTTYVAFIRAINVAGHPLVKMSDIRESVAAAGAQNVRTYIQSGNVVFDCSDRTSATILKKIHANLRALVGSNACVLFRTLRDLDRIVRASPFSEFASEPRIKLYVAFLSDKPVEPPRLPMTSPKEALEAVAIQNREAFIVSRPKPNGFFGFPNNFIEKELGITATSRNRSTVTKIVKFAREV